MGWGEKGSREGEKRRADREDYSARSASPLRGRPPGVSVSKWLGVLATSARNTTRAEACTLRALSLFAVVQT